MRIVLDLQACQAENRQRGIGRYSMSLAEHIARAAATGGRDHEVHIVLNALFADTVEPIRRAFDGLVARERISVFAVPPGLAASAGGNAWRTRAAELLRAHYLASLRPDLVHTASLFEGWGDDAVASLGDGAAGAHAALTLYDLIPLVREAHYLADPAMRAWYYRKLGSLKCADLALAISEHSRREALHYLQLAPERVVNISSAVDPVFAPRAPDAERRAALGARYGLTRAFLMYTGGIDFRKNIDGLIGAFARLPAALRAAHQLAIVCSITPPDRQRLMALAQREGLAADALILTGYVPEPDLIDLYNLATAFVFPSLHEGFGLPVLEAMACGTPVIGADASSIPEVIGRADALFDPTNLAAMSAKIAQVLGEPDLRASLRAHGLRQAAGFSWEASARRALDAFEQLGAPSRRSGAAVNLGAAGLARPPLAYLSPLPPDQSGIADYSAHLIAELGRYYTITVVAQSAVSDPWVLANCAIRSIDWFDAHADRFERIVYHFGNSSFHGHMFALLARHPGLVVLHDFYLSGIVNYLDNTGQQPGAFEQALFHSHGYGALLMAQQQGREAALWAHPCNLKVLQDAAGVIVHSQYARELAARWYGARLADDWLVMPFPRAAEAGDRAAARARLGVPEGDYLTCSFGLLGSTKRNHVLLAAWLASSLADDPACQLVFVGENASGPYGEQLRQAIAASGRAARIKITGFASPALYRDYLAAADSAVQLRGTSRGETSAAIMDCMAHALPLIINANGAAADIGADLVLRLPDDFAPAQLSEALDALRRQPAQAAAMAARAAAHIHALHHPYAVGMRYRDAIEQVCRTSASAAETALLRSCAAQPTPPAPGDLIEVARCVARNRRGRGAQRQLLVDVSELAQRDAKSGIQRVVRNIVGALLREPPPGFRVEPIYEQDGRYRYARRFTCALLGLDAGALDDDDIGFAPGDRYLGLDLLPHTVPRNAHLFEDWRNAGVEIHFVVYDLLPLLRPDVFVPHADEGHRRWLASTVAVADGLMCISRAVADEVAGWLATADLPARAPLGIGYFHLGADLEAARTPAVPTAQEQAILARIEGAPSVLMVGTLEPRKGYAQALDAFELLWAAGQQVTLVIVGKNGWMVEALVKRLASHPERAARLVWLDSASDSLLLQLYQHASALLAASEAEGFGLPLIEAAQHGLPIIARDLPVFREVAGEHASYFSGAGAADLAACLTRWLAVHAQGQAPASAGMPWLTWADSARQLMRRIDHGAWYRHWPAGAGAPTPYCDGTDDTRRQR